MYLVKNHWNWRNWRLCSWGYLVETSNVNAYNEAMNHFLRHQNLSAKMQMEMEKYSTLYSIEETAKSYMKVYMRCLQQENWNVTLFCRKSDFCCNICTCCYFAFCNHLVKKDANISRTFFLLTLVLSTLAYFVQPAPTMDLYRLWITADEYNRYSTLKMITEIFQVGRHLWDLFMFA